MSEQRIAWRTAEPMAAGVRNVLAETCLQIEIAGSIRRRAADVKDAEIVAIPTAATYRVIESKVADGDWSKAVYSDGRMRWGDKYRGIEVQQVDERTDQRTRLRVELFFTERDSWGYQLALRTGPGDANRALMQWMAATPVRCIDGAVWFAEDWVREGEDWISGTKRRVLLASEADWFALWGMDVVDPWDRRADLYRWARFDGAAMLLGDAPARQQSLF